MKVKRAVAHHSDTTFNPTFQWRANMKLNIHDLNERGVDVRVDQDRGVIEFVGTGGYTEQERDALLAMCKSRDLNDQEADTFFDSVADALVAATVRSALA